MSRISSTNYRSQAADCRAQAEMSRNKIDKATWLVLASDWIKLAESTDPLSAAFPDRPPAEVVTSLPGRRVRPMLLGSKMENKLFDEQSLQLLRAFFRVRGPDERAKIIELVESSATDVERSARAADDRSIAE